MHTTTSPGRLRSALVKTGAALAVCTLVTLSALGSAASASADDIVDRILSVTAPADPAAPAEPAAPADLGAPADPAAPTDPAVPVVPTPVAQNDTFPGGIGTTDLYPADLYLNDSDAAPTSLEIDDPAGEVTVSGGWIHVPIAIGFSGNRTFNYRFSNAIGTSNWAVVTVVVNPGFAQPIAYSDSYLTPNNVTLAVAAPGVLANDDAVGATVTSLSDLTNEVVIHPNGSFEYTPVAGFVGVKTFFYQVTANGLPSNWGKVSITVTASTGSTPAPVAMADSYQTAQGVDLDVAANGVLVNDSSSTATVFDTNDSTGEIFISVNGALHYSPPVGFAGTKTLEYRILDAGQISNWATITIDVTPVATPAPVAVNDTYSMDMNTTLNIAASGVLANDSSGITWWDGGFYSGTMALYSDGSFVYTPDVGFTGIAVIEYTIRDHFVTSNVATITIEVVDPQLSTLGLNDPVLPLGTLAFTGVNSTWLAIPALSIFLLGSLALGYSAARRRRAGTV